VGQVGVITWSLIIDLSKKSGYPRSRV
jgi:hypothetical protein